MYIELVAMLENLEGVRQDPTYHPEGDALFHSLQVFERALADDASGSLLAAALLHDVGKAVAGYEHAEAGAGLLSGLMPSEATWLVQHHMDLQRSRKSTLARWHGTKQGKALTQLHRYDQRGRELHASVRSIEEAVSIVLESLEDERHEA